MHDSFGLHIACQGPGCSGPQRGEAAPNMRPASDDSWPKDSFSISRQEQQAARPRHSRVLVRLRNQIPVLAKHFTSRGHRSARVQPERSARGVED